jgi:hypothetical protein
MEETSIDESNDIPCSQQASAANVCLSEVEEYLQFLMRLQGLSDSDFYKFMPYSSLAMANYGDAIHTENTRL